jgi:hypothetical protein
MILCDRFEDVIDALIGAFGLRYRRLPREVLHMPVFLFVCNSVTPGRCFGDPYAGEIAAFVPTFARAIDGSRSRLAIIYYPHQAHSQFLSGFGSRNKGITVLKGLTDYVVFHGGVTMNSTTGEIL